MATSQGCCDSTGRPKSLTHCLAFTRFKSHFLPFFPSHPYSSKTLHVKRPLGRIIPILPPHRLGRAQEKPTYKRLQQIPGSWAVRAGRDHLARHPHLSEGETKDQRGQVRISRRPNQCWRGCVHIPFALGDATSWSFILMYLPTPALLQG